MARALVVTGLVVCGVMVTRAPSAVAAQADGPRLEVSARTTDPSAPVVVLTNVGTVACEVATNSLGAITLNRVEQAGALVEPIYFDTAFDDGLVWAVVAGLRLLEPGASVEVPIPVVALGPTGTALETVARSFTTPDLGSLYPIRSDRALAFDVLYAEAPLTTASKGRVCPTAASAPHPPTVAGSESSQPDVPSWLTVGAGTTAAGLAFFAGFMVVRRRSRRGRPDAGVAILIVLISLAAAVATEVRPADAAITAEPGVAAAWTACKTILHEREGDPAGILPRLEGGDVKVKLLRASGTVTHEGAASPTDLWVLWDPDDRHPYFGTGGDADPCTTLYHALFYASADARGGQDFSPCLTRAGETGLTVDQVNATWAQNLVRQHLGLPARSHYGRSELPAGTCLGPERQAREPVCQADGCGEFNGVSHLHTFDGARYDFQAVGDFVAFRDPAGGFELQVRQEAFPGSRTASYITTVMMDVAGDIVEIEASGFGFSGSWSGSKPFEPMPGGGSMDSVADLRWAKTVTWPDGSSVILTKIGPWGMRVTVQLAEARRGRLEGLLGNFDGDASDDIRPRGGQPIAGPAIADLDPQHVDSWRVTSASSLFFASTSPAAENSIPDRQLKVDDMGGREGAEVFCRKRGVDDAHALASCAFDLVVTGQPDFVTASLSSQTFLNR